MAEAIIRQKDGYKNAKAIDFANDIFLSGDLNRDYIESKDKANFDWEMSAKKYKGKLRSEFVDQNILNARVQALKMLSQKEDRFWSDYIKYNIQLIEKYGYDTTDGFSDALIINNFICEAIIPHSNDAVHYRITLKWMDGVLRRNEKEDSYPNYLDTYASLLFKSGEKEKAIKWQMEAFEIAKKTQSIFLIEISKNLERMKGD